MPRIGLQEAENWCVEGRFEGRLAAKWAGIGGERGAVAEVQCMLTKDRIRIILPIPSRQKMLIYSVIVVIGSVIMAILRKAEDAQ